MIVPSSSRRGRPARQGFTLIEMLTAIFVFTTVMGLCVALVDMLLKLNESGQAQTEAAETVSRMALAFRADVHAATGAQDPTGAPPTPSGSSLILTLPENRTIAYQVDKGRLVRTERKAGEFVRNEGFTLPARVGRIEHTQTHGQTVLALVFDRRVSTKRGIPRELRIEATLGTSHRFEGEVSQ